MPHASHRLDLVLCPPLPDDTPDLDAAWALGMSRGWWAEDGRPGPRATEVVPGGFARVRLEQHERPRLFANQVGGFQVRCPVTEEPIVAAFQAAMRGWRGGGARTIPRCPACGAEHALEDLLYRPDAAFARAALLVADAEAAQPGEGLRRALEDAWGGLRVVARRVGS